ncbi:unnamed protein product [Mesocestoides corti]|uniref:BACK domain-containing protein n=1 Tax=Mesocestoides corti TaxID=53468 RepID=A0A0R3UI16_MESCO|nr:unnamed protein product [Mesocestoides corti]
MSESRSGEFFLSEFSPRQLQHLKHFLSNNDLFSSKVEPLLDECGQSVSSDCQKEEEVRRLVEAAFIADYLQMPRFKSKLRTLFQYLLQSLTHPQSACFSRLHDCGTFTEMVPILSDHRLRCLKRPLLRFLYRHPTILLSSRFVNLDARQPYLIMPIMQTLSSDKIFLTSEDEILNTICDWMQFSLTEPKRCRTESSHTSEMLRSVITSLRLGLLSNSGLQNLANLLNDYPQCVAADAYLNRCLSSIRTVLSYNLRSHFQAVLSARLLHSTLGESAFRPRADVPTLTIVARQNSTSSSFVLYFLDLLSGQVLSSLSPLCVERTLLFEPSESNPIHLCTAETHNCQNLVFLFIHQINTATLKGLIWDLATLEAEWMPELDLKHSSFAWATNSFSTSSLPHSVGIVYTADGLMVYCSFTLCNETVLCVYRFDPPSWTWIKYYPKPFRAGLHHKVLKPMPHATPQGLSERWLYGTLDSGDGSQFIRMRPAGTPGSGDYSVEVQTLPSPDFILRAYDLVSVRLSNSDEQRAVGPRSGYCACVVSIGGARHGDGGGGGGDKNSPDEVQPANIFTFPFNACQRDSQAMHMCYSQSQNEWMSWEPASSSPDLSPSYRETLQFSLSREQIGFRGIVCTSSLPIKFGSALDDNENCVDEEEVESLTEFPNNAPSLDPGSYFVMAGRLSQSVVPPAPKVSGLWLLDPTVSRSTSTARQPTFPLPPSLDSLLHRATAVCGTVVLANWTALQAATQSSSAAAAVTPRPTKSSTVSSSSIPIMRFSQHNRTNGVSGMSSGSSSALFACHRPSTGAGSDSD